MGKHKETTRDPSTSSGSATELANLQTTARRIAQVSRYYAEVFYAGETPWFYLRYWLGIPATVFAAGAAAFAFLSVPHNNTISGLASGFVAVLSALYLALDPMARALAFHTTAAAYEVLYHDVVFFQRIHLPDLSVGVAVQRARLEALHVRLTMLKNVRPAVAARCYRRAERVLKGDVLGEVKDDDAFGA